LASWRSARVVFDFVGWLGGPPEALDTYVDPLGHIVWSRDSTGVDERYVTAFVDALCDQEGHVYDAATLRRLCCEELVGHG
jgi:hypothetical protein